MNELAHTLLEIGFLILKASGLFLLFVIVAALLDLWVGGRGRLRKKAGADTKKHEN